MIRSTRSVSRRRGWAARSAAAVAIVLVLAVTRGASAPPEGGDDTGRSEEPLTSGMVERAEVQIGLLEVVVVDRKGRHVRGIPPSAFELRARKSPVPIVSVDEIDLVSDEARERRRSREAPAPSEPEATEAGTGVTLPPEATEALTEAREARLSGPRWFVLVFDGYNNVSPLRMSQMRRAAKGWLARNMRPNDRAAVYAFSPFLSSLCDFTGDLDILYRAIDEAPVFPNSGQMGREMIEQRLEQGERMPREFLEQQLLNASRFGEDLLSAERDQFYDNMTSLGAVLGGLRGSRAVLLFSGGFPITRSRTTAAAGGFTGRFKDMLTVLGITGVRVFSYDIGEEGGFTDLEESGNTRIQMENLGLGAEWLDDLQVGAQITALNAHQEILVALAAETGGRFFGGKNYRDFLDAADDDMSHYYLIGYRPEDVRAATGDEAAYVPLRVDVGERGYRVIARQGQFDPPAPPPPREPQVETRPVVPGSRQAGGPKPTLATRPEFFPLDDGSMLVVLPMTVTDVPDLPVAGDRRVLDLTVEIGASSSGETVLAGDRDLRLEVPDDKVAALAGGLRIREAMVLPAGTHLQLEAKVRFNGLSRSATWSGDVDVPPAPEGRFGVTDLVVLSPSDATPLLFDAFHGEGAGVHAVDGVRQVADPLGAERDGRPPEYVGGAVPREVPVLVQTRLIAPPPPPADGESPLRMDWELVPVSGADALAPPVEYRRLRMVDSGAALDVVIGLDLSAVEPGAYRLRLTAENLTAGVTDRHEVPLDVGP